MITSAYASNRLNPSQASLAPLGRAEMQMEIAMGLQQRPKNAAPLHGSAALRRRALKVTPEPAAHAPFSMGLAAIRLLRRRFRA